MDALRRRALSLRVESATLPNMHGAFAPLLASLVVLSGPSRSPASGVERPQAFVSIPKPNDGLPKLRATSDRLLGARPGEALFGAEAARLGFDLLDPAALERVGVALDAPLWILVPSGQRAALVELTLAKPELADAAIARGLASGGRVRALSSSAPSTPTTSSKGVSPPSVPGFAFGLVEDPTVLVWRSGSKLYVRASRGAAPTSERASFELAREAAKPALPKFPGSAAPDAVLVGRGEEGVEQIEAGLWIGSESVEVRADLRLDLPTRLLLGDFTAHTTKSAPLVAITEPALELTASAAPAAIRRMFEAESLPVELARVLAGHFHVALSRGGSLAAVASLKEAAADAQVVALTRALAQRFPEARIERSAPGLLTAFFAGADAELVTPALAEEPKDATPRAPVELRTNPKTAFDALSARARARRGPAPPLARLALARFWAADLIRNSKALRVELSFGEGVVKSVARLALEAR